METIYINIQLDPKKGKREAKRQSKRSPDVDLLFIVSVVVLVMLVFDIIRMIHSLANKPDDVVQTIESTEVTGGNRNLDHEDIYTVPELIPPEPSEAETDSIETANFVATAYCGCEKCCGKWASFREEGPITGAAGTPLVEGISVAVDNNLYRFGTEFTDHEGNKYIAADTGSAIVGNRIDIYFEDHQEALEFGVQEITLSWEEG